MKEKKRYITKYQEKKEKKDKKIYQDYMIKTADKNNSKTEVVKYLMKKHRLNAISSIYAAIHREEKRLNKQQ